MEEAPFPKLVVNILIHNFLELLGDEGVAWHQSETIEVILVDVVVENLLCAASSFLWCVLLLTYD